MDELPEVYGIRKMHAEDLSGSRQKLFDFLSGWMGGPQLYVEKHGHPMLRRRHLHFSIFLLLKTAHPGRPLLAIIMILAISICRIYYTFAARSNEM